MIFAPFWEQQTSEDRREMHEPACCPLLLVAQRQWEEERTKMREQIEKQCVDAKRLKRRFKMLQTTLEVQQKVLDRYQETIRKHGLLCPPEGEAPSASKEGIVPSSTSDAPSPARKRTKVTAPPNLKRQSLPVAHERKSASTVLRSSPERRRSLPENQHERSERHATNKASFDSWRARKKGMDSFGGRTVHASDFVTRRSVDGGVENRPPRVEVRKAKEEQSTSTDSFLEDGKLPPQRKPLKNEGAERRSPPRSIFAAHKRPLSMHQDSSTSSAMTTAVSSSNSRASERLHGFAYVEVVRNRQERAALPAYDCVECRKYYEALDGLVPESEMKAMCSRHRARFEPYQTPDDFWRLSFPDSPSHSPTTP